MPRSKKPRKGYRPTGVNLQAHLVAIQGSALLSLDDRIRWQADLADALAHVRRASAVRAHWASLFDAINVAEELVRMKLARDEHDIVTRAQAAVLAILDRLQATGVRSARADELHALTDLVTAHADLMDGITHQQKYDAEARVADRVRRVLSQPDKPEPGVRVVEAHVVASPNRSAQPC